MSKLLRRPPSAQDLPGFAAEHACRWRRLQEDRQFRAEQLAALEAEHAGGQGRESVQLALRIAATTALSEIDAALARMASGEYGKCVSCAKPISAARLDVLPATPLCTSCDFNE